MSSRAAPDGIPTSFGARCYNMTGRAPPRQLAVLDLMAEKANWQHPPAGTRFWHLGLRRLRQLYRDHRRSVSA